MPVCWPYVWPPASTAPDSPASSLGITSVACYKRATPRKSALSPASPRQPATRHPRQRRRPEDVAGPRSATVASRPSGGNASVPRAGGHPSEGAPQGLRPSSPGQELICSGIGLTLKASLALVACVSLVRLGGAYQQRLDRYGEVSAVFDIQQAKLLKALNRFDTLFATGGEQKLIKEQDQWIAPNRLRVVWTTPTQP